MTPETKATLLAALHQAEGDDLYRAEAAFRGLPPAKMNEEYGESGRTRQQILDGYRAHVVKIKAALNEVGSL